MKNHITNKEIVNFIVDTWAKEDNKDESCIDLYQVLKEFCLKNTEFHQLQENIKNRLIHKEMGMVNQYIIKSIGDFEFLYNQSGPHHLCFECCVNKKDNQNLIQTVREKFEIYDKDDDLVLGDESFKVFGSNPLKVAGKEIADLFYFYRNNEKYVEFEEKNMKICGTDFNVNIGKENFYFKIGNLKFDSEFSFEDRRYKYNCSINSNNVMSLLNSNEKINGFLGKIYVRIADCPEFCQEALAATRMKQIHNCESMKSLKKFTTN